MGWSLAIITPRFRWFFKKTPVVDDIQASLTSTKIEQSASGRKNNQEFSREDEEEASEEANVYADVKYRSK